MLKKIRLIGEQKKVLFLPPTNPIQIKGVAGSGKTTVSLYRAKHLLDTQNNLFQEANIAIFTYNKTLANYIKELLPFINGGYQQNTDEIRKVSLDGLNVSITNFHRWAYHFANLKSEAVIKHYEQKKIIDQVKHRFHNDISRVLEKSSLFFQEEISWIKGKLLQSKSEYLQAARTGRGTNDRITKEEKVKIWEFYEIYKEILDSKRKYDFDDFALLSLRKINNDPNFQPPFTHIIVDEAQDLNKAQITVLSKVVSRNTNSITIIADAAQRIYKSGFNWKEVGINVRGGRTVELQRNYRNTIPIAQAAVSLLEHEEDQTDFTQIQSALIGEEKPKIIYSNSFDDQLNYFKNEINNIYANGDDISVVILHRTLDGVNKIHNFLERNGIETVLLKTNERVDFSNNKIKLCTMSSIKGLEFDVVFIMDISEYCIPYPPGFSQVEDEIHISTERRLLYTSMTRARTKLYISCDKNRPSRFINEINPDFVEIIDEFNGFDETDDDLPF
jgi:superfamily I DNA/RNA helicase